MYQSIRNKVRIDWDGAFGTGTLGIGGAGGGVVRCLVCPEVVSELLRSSASNARALLVECDAVEYLLCEEMYAF